MTNLIASLVLIAILAGAVASIVRAKKNGAKCIGCPAGCRCGRSGASGCCGCRQDGE